MTAAGKEHEAIQRLQLSEICWTETPSGVMEVINNA